MRSVADNTARSGAHVGVKSRPLHTGLCTVHTPGQSEIQHDIHVATPYKYAIYV